MCDKAILENGGTLKSVFDCCKNQEMCNKAVDNYLHVDDNPHNIRDNQDKSNQLPPFSLSQRPSTPAFSRTQSRCNVIGLVSIWEFPGVNSQFQGTSA